MTNSERTKIITEFGMEYMGPDWKKKVTQTRIDIWKDAIKDWDYGKAKKAARQFFIDHPAYAVPFNYKFPNVDFYKKIYEEFIAPDHQDCEFCKGSGFVTVVIKGEYFSKSCDRRTHNQEIPVDVNSEGYQAGLKLLKPGGDIKKLVNQLAEKMK
jgi:hypothetical protein